MKRGRALELFGLILLLMLGLAGCGGNSSSPSDSGQSQSSTNLLPAIAATNWTLCASEEGICSFAGTAQVRYGFNGTYAYRTATGSIGCNNQVFGDPILGADKVCEYQTATPIPDPTPDPTPPPLSCEGIISRCLDLGAVWIAKYMDNKEAAASYTFDDGYASSSKVATIFENRGLRATFYLVAGAVEINAAQAHIEQQMGTRPLSFAFPWHAYTSQAISVAEQNHISVRRLSLADSSYRFAFFDQDHAPTLAAALSDANNTLSEVVSLGGWMVAGGHGVDGDGWSPVTSAFLQDHLSHASTYSSRLWIDTYLNVARYRLCRPQVAPAVTSSSSSQAIVHLGGGSGAVCAAPLTVVVPIKEPLSGEIQARTSSGLDVPVKIIGGRLLFNMIPGSDVILEVAQTAS